MPTSYGCGAGLCPLGTQRTLKSFMFIIIISFLTEIKRVGNDFYECPAGNSRPTLIVDWLMF